MLLCSACLPDFQKIDDGAAKPAGSSPGAGSSGGDPSLPDAGDCCSSSPSDGCKGTPVEACVCAEDTYCCDSEWDQACAAEVGLLGCGSCPGAEGDTEGGGDGLKCASDADCNADLPRCNDGACVTKGTERSAHAIAAGCT